MRGCHGTNGFCHQHEVNGEQLSLPPPSSPFTSGESPCPSRPERPLAGQPAPLCGRQEEEEEADVAHAAREETRLANAWFYPRGDWYTLYWDGSLADKVARRAVFPTLEHENYDPGPLAERIRRDKRELSDRSSDDWPPPTKTHAAPALLDDFLGYGSDSGSG